VTSPVSRSVVRRLLAVATTAAALTVAGVLAAGPAAADAPEAWPDADPISSSHVLLVLVGIPVLVFVVIALLVYAPSVARGESLKPGDQDPDQWLGGPRKATRELAAPDSEGSAAGGAGGSW
jgi:hypothetical protein